jgi:hypothetical protein
MSMPEAQRKFSASLLDHDTFCSHICMLSISTRIIIINRISRRLLFLEVFQDFFNIHGWRCVHSYGLRWITSRNIAQVSEFDISLPGPIISSSLDFSQLPHLRYTMPNRTLSLLWSQFCICRNAQRTADHFAIRCNANTSWTPLFSAVIPYLQWMYAPTIRAWPTKSSGVHVSSRIQSNHFCYFPWYSFWNISYGVAAMPSIMPSVPRHDKNFFVPLRRVISCLSWDFSGLLSSLPSATAYHFCKLVWAVNKFKNGRRM